MVDVVRESLQIFCKVALGVRETKGSRSVRRSPVVTGAYAHSVPRRVFAYTTPPRISVVVRGRRAMMPGLLDCVGRGCFRGEIA